MLPHLLFFTALAIAASLFALLEIQIEGSAGWATALPTWRVQTRWTRAILGSRALTGYHLYVHLFVFLLLHLPFALAPLPPTWSIELRILAFWVLFWVLEDYLWFVFNPEFGVGRFSPTHASWHAPSWWWIMPREYWIFTPVGVALYLLSWGV